MGLSFSDNLIPPKGYYCYKKDHTHGNKIMMFQGGVYMNCKYCQKPTKVLNNIEVCNDCCTVSFSKDIEPKQKHKLIMDYLNDIQTKRVIRKDYLNDIDKKHRHGIEIKPIEREILDNIEKFQSISIDLKGAIMRNSNLNEKKEQNSLYHLLVLSEWLSEFFNTP